MTLSPYTQGGIGLGGVLPRKGTVTLRVVSPVAVNTHWPEPYGGAAPINPAAITLNTALPVASVVAVVGFGVRVPPVAVQAAPITTPGNALPSGPVARIEIDVVWLPLQVTETALGLA